MTICKQHEFTLLGDGSGSLAVLDESSGVPFDIKRVYYIFNVKEGIARGFHAHKQLHQIAICVAGSCRMILDNGIVREEIKMTSPCIGVDIPPMLWHEMYDFTEDCVLVVLASDHYDEADYIRDYQEFRERVSR